MDRVMNGGARWALEHGDSLEVLPRFEEGSVDAFVTSPPYLDQRKYGSTRRRTAYATASRVQRRVGSEAWLEWVEPFLAAMLRAVSPAGSLMLNLGRVMREGEEHPYALETLLLARELGWKWVDTVIWHKPNSIPLSHPAYLHGKHEWVWWLAKETDCYRGYDRDTRSPHSPATIRRIGQPYMTRKDERYSKRGKTAELHPDGARPATVFAAGVGDQRGLKHPAVMSRATALHLVSLSCPHGGVVVDPFAGSCTTGVAALTRGRRFVGIEREAEYLPEARGRLKVATDAGEALRMAL